MQPPEAATHLVHFGDADDNRFTLSVVADERKVSNDRVFKGNLPVLEILIAHPR